MQSSVDIVIPVYNEEHTLPQNLAVLTGFLEQNLANPWQVIVADNASTDGTRQVTEEFCSHYPKTSYLHIPRKGKGLALRTAWMASTADIVSFMDADLSTELVHFPQLIQALSEGNDIAVGSRLSRGAKVNHRSIRRELISRIYNLMVRSLFLTRLRDSQCGFKAMTRQAAQAIVPNIRNTKFFFDTELLLIAVKSGYQVKQVPVEWNDDPESAVNVIGHSTDSLKGLMRLRFGGIPNVAAPNHVVTKT